MSVHVPAKDMHLVGDMSTIFNSQNYICTKMTNFYHSVVSVDISESLYIKECFHLHSIFGVQCCSGDDKGKIFVKYIPYADNYSLLN